MRGIQSEPWVEISWEPLPHGRESEVVVETGRTQSAGFDSEIGQRLLANLAKLRPESSDSLGIVWSAQAAHDLFSESAIRKMTFRWLEDDLRRISWLDGY